MPALASELQRQAHDKRDFLARSDALHVSSNGHTDLHVPTLPPLLVNDTAHGQLAEYLGVPKGFYDFLRARTQKLRTPVPLPAVRSENPRGYDPNQLPLYEEQPLFDVMLNRLLASQGRGAAAHPYPRRQGARLPQPVLQPRPRQLRCVRRGGEGDGGDRAVS